MSKLQIIDDNDTVGIRTINGFICTFIKPTHWPGQDERYAKELCEMRKYLHLFAAAPDLLEACKLALKRFSLLRALFTPPVYCPALNMEDIEPYDMNVVDTLTVAIEKALKGKEK